MILDLICTNVGNILSMFQLLGNSKSGNLKFHKSRVHAETEISSSFLGQGLTLALLKKRFLCFFFDILS